MRRMIRHLSSQFGHRLADYSYPQLRRERPRITERETQDEIDVEPAAETPSNMSEERVAAQKS